MSHPNFPLVAVDVGNRRAKLGLFAAGGESFPVPQEVALLDGQAPDFARLDAWLGGRPPLAWHVASVNRPLAQRLSDWIASARPDDQVQLLSADGLSLRVAVPRPDLVGIDRLLDAVAANRLRRPAAAAVVIDVGSAITVDAVSAEGVFLGGAILPGIEMSARALHAFTDLLPLVEIAELDAPPPALGTSTVAAIASGLFWGAVGAIRELVARLGAGEGGAPDVFLTGGAGPSVAGLLGENACYQPHLTLGGIVLAAVGQGD